MKLVDLLKDALVVDLKGARKQVFVNTDANRTPITI